MTSERDREIKRRRHRRDKVRKLRSQLEKTTDMRQRSVIIRKIKVVRPTCRCQRPDRAAFRRLSNCQEITWRAGSVTLARRFRG